VESVKDFLNETISQLKINYKPSKSEKITHKKFKFIGNKKFPKK
jgi:hypothetical protein